MITRNPAIVEPLVAVLREHGFAPRSLMSLGWNSPDYYGHDINATIDDSDMCLCWTLSFRRKHPQFGMRVTGRLITDLVTTLVAIKEGVRSMDPDANLEEQRRIVERVTKMEDAGLHHDVRDLPRLVELVAALDEWISKGGALPAAWRKDS